MGLWDDIKEVHYDRNDNETQRNSNNEVLEILNECRESGSDLDQALESKGWKKRPDNENIYHQNPSGVQGFDAFFNVKYTHENGDGTSSEVILCEIPTKEPYIVTDSINAGTFNYVDPVGLISGGLHGVLDVFPYWMYGNDRNEKTSKLKRIFGYRNSKTIQSLSIGDFTPQNMGDSLLIQLGGVAGYGFMVAQNAWAAGIVIDGDFSNIKNVMLRNVKKESKHFVPDGVFLVCSEGTKMSHLRVTSQFSVKIAGGKLQGTVNDRMDCNMNCAKMVIVGAILGAVVAVIAVVAVVALEVCTCGVGLAAVIGAGGAIAGGLGGMLTSFIPCVCSYLTGGVPWIPVHTFVKIEKQMALIETSKLNCFLGGQIQIIYNDKTASEIADMNKKQMFFDWGNIIIDSVFISVAATAGSSNFINLLKGVGVKEMILEFSGSLLFGSSIFLGTEIVKWGEERIFHSQSNREVAIKSHDENLYSLGDSNRGDFDNLGTIGSFFTNIFDESDVVGVQGAFARGFKPRGISDFSFLGLGVGQTFLSFVEDEVIADEILDVVDSENTEKAARATIHVIESDIK